MNRTACRHAGKVIKARQYYLGLAAAKDEANEKVLKLVDAYPAAYIDEEHSECHLNDALREKVLKHNIQP